MFKEFLSHVLKEFFIALFESLKLIGIRVLIAVSSVRKLVAFVSGVIFSYINRVSILIQYALQMELNGNCYLRLKNSENRCS